MTLKNESIFTLVGSVWLSCWNKKEKKFLVFYVTEPSRSNFVLFDNNKCLFKLQNLGLDSLVSELWNALWK